MPVAFAARSPEGKEACDCGREGCDCQRRRSSPSPPSTSSAALALAPASDRYEHDAVRVADRLAPDVPAGPAQDRLSGRQRTFFESRLGTGLGDVRLHTDEQAAGSARELSARAYTLGPDIWFGQGQHQPETGAGRWLLAHEVAHVVQQQTPGGPAGQVQRTTLQDCTSPQTPDLLAAVPIATSDLDTAIAAVSARPLTQKVIDALWLAFRRSTVEAADQVLGVLQRARTYLPNATVECEQPGDTGYGLMCTGADAYVRAAWALLRTGNIHLCMGSFAGNTTQYKAEVLIHESTHRSSNTADEGYYLPGWTESPETVGLTPGQRLDNADSFAAFVHYIAHDSDATLASRAAEWRGERLTLTQDPAGPITLAASDVRSPKFRVEGWPGGGLQFRWVIAEAYGTAGDRRYLVRATSNDSVPFDWGPFTEVYIGKPTRDLLASRNVREATLLCRMQNVDGSDRLLTAPLRFVP